MSLMPPRQQIASFFARGFTTQGDLLAPVETPDGQGGQRRTYPVQATVMVSLNTLSAAEKQAQGAIGATYTHRILMAYRTGIKPTWRFAVGSRIFDIHTITDYGEQHVVTELMVEEMYTK